MAETTITTNGRGDKLRQRIKLMNLEILFLRQNVQFFELLAAERKLKAKRLGLRASFFEGLAAADTVVNRLFFLKDTFEGLSNPNIDRIEFSPYALFGFYEILEDLVSKAMDVTEILNGIQRR